ncbi:MAG: hypothetical protein ACOCZV_00605 [Nanoarchaeota archaeon]
MKSKGQVTIFVILGAIILLGVGLVIFLNQDIQEDNPAVDVPDVSLEARPVTELITQCLQKTSEEALHKVGMQGGYTSPPAASRPSYEGEAVEYTPFSVPYWRHLTSQECDNPSGCDATEQPKLCDSLSRTCNYRSASRTTQQSIETQLERYVLDNIDYCIEDFESIEMYEIEKTDKPSVNVMLANEQTDFILDYPIVIRSLTQEGNKKELEDFGVSFDVDLVNIYKLADEIMKYEREYNLYETKTMDLVNIFAGLDSKLPPTAEMDFKGSSKGPWIQTEVKQLLESEVLPYMMLMSVINSNNPRIIEYGNESDEYSQYAQGIYKGFMFASSENEYDLNVDHKYAFSPIHLMIGNGAELIQGKKINPSENTESGELFNIFADMMSFGMIDYRFDYDISYPLIIEIEDPDAFNGEGYTFQFASEVNVRDNEPGYDNFTSITVPTSFESNLGDYRFRPEQEITVDVYDKHSGEPVENAFVGYACGDEYDIGSTEIEDGAASITTRFPYCEFGGSIIVNAPDYARTSVPFNNPQDGSSETFNIGLWPFKEKTIFLKARSPENISLLQNDPQNFWVNVKNASHPLDEYQTGFAIVDRKKETAYDGDVPLMGIGQFVGKNTSAFSHMNQSFEKMQESYTKDYQEGGKLSQEDYETGMQALENSRNVTGEYVDDEMAGMTNITMRLVPGNYSVETTLLYSDKITIEEYEKNDDMEYPQINLTSWVQGSNRVNVTLSEDELYGNSTMTLYALEMPLPVAWERSQLEDFCDDDKEKYCTYLDQLDDGLVAVMNDIPESEAYQQGKEEMLQPTFSSE